MLSLALAFSLSFAVQSGSPGDGVLESPYAVWENGPPTDPNWFPIAVWLQDPALADRYASLGINTFVGLWQGPTREQLTLLRQADMRVVCSMNKVALGMADQAGIIAWMQEDEPDNQKTPPEKLKTRYARYKQRDSTRPVWLNLGQGVANDAWKGRRSPRAWYPDYVAASDIVCFDVYPVTNLRRADGGDYLWILAKGLQRLKQWSGGGKPRWNMIECTRVHQAKLKPTPAQVESEVWISLIHGSRGIVYFCHNFKPKTEPAALLADQNMSQAVARINERVLRYAPVLNAPDLKDVVRISTPDGQAPVAMLVKRVGDWTYLFCVGMRNKPTLATFEWLGDMSKAQGLIEVLDEERTLPVRAGSFQDAFTPFGVHLYRLKRSER